jgi:membrane-bound ClpP family serine protease
VPATLVTNALTAIFITHSLNGIQLTQMALLVAGMALIVLFARKATASPQQISSVSA